MTTHSEDGREVPEVVGIITASGMRQGVNSVVSRPALHDLRPGDTLMTVAQHERIVAAKDAEIERLTHYEAAYRIASDQLSKANGRYSDLYQRYQARNTEVEALRAQPARQVGVDDIACDRAYRNGLISGFNHGINSDEDSFNRSLNAYQREIHQATPELRDAIAPAASKVNSGCYVQDVPEHCDRITWRGHYYGLPPLAPAAAAVVLPERMVITRYSSDEYAMCAKHWNEALDSVARLNRRAIPERLLERVASPWIDDEELIITRHVAINKLRALLSKENI